MAVYTPLLLEIGCKDGVRFLRALADFCILAMYRSHDDETLGYLAFALYRMNQYKEAFRHLRPLKTKVDETGYFNFPKFHSLVHYIKMIQEFGNAVDLESGHAEHWHVRFVKDVFPLTNKKTG